MHISWFGLAAFKIESKDAVVVTDPFRPELAKRPVRAKADIVTISTPDDPAQSYLGGVQGEPFVIDHPGEFEVRGVFLRGIPVVGAARSGPGARTDSGTPASTTIFTLDLEGIRLAHLGSLHESPSEDVVERLGEVDLLFVPVGGGDVLDAGRAARLVQELEPRLVVPMSFAVEGVRAPSKRAPVSAFLREMGASHVVPEERLLLRERDLPTAEETRVVVFRV